MTAVMHEPVAPRQSVALHHVVDGSEDAPVLLLGGSLGSTVAMWEPQVPALAARFRVVRYDARGHGGSPVPPGPYVIDDLVADVVALLDHLGVRRASFAGLSLGGVTGMRLAALHPDRVDRLALVCTSARWPDPQPWLDRAAAVRAGGTASIADTVVQRWFTADGAQREPALVERSRVMVAATPADGYAACCEALAAMDVRGDLARIVAPTLVLAGEQDAATPPAMLEAIAAGIAGARLQVLQGAAHLANLEQPEVVTAALLAHLDPAGTTYEQGMRTRREVLGDAYVDRAVAATSALTAPFQDHITRTAWGEVWSRPGLSRASRSMVTLAVLAALGHDDELGLHVRAALRNGLTADEIGEVLLQTSVYAGVPAANSAFAVAQRVLAEEGAS